jgi:hypothetical protein
MGAPDEPTADRLELLSMIPAEPGWTAQISIDVLFEPNPTIKPVVMWGLFRRTKVVIATGEVVEDYGNTVEGIIPWHANASGVYLTCAQGIGDEEAVYQLPGTVQPT